MIQPHLVLSLSKDLLVAGFGQNCTNHWLDPHKKKGNKKEFWEQICLFYIYTRWVYFSGKKRETHRARNLCTDDTDTRLRLGQFLIPFCQRSASKFYQCFSCDQIVWAVSEPSLHSLRCCSSNSWVFPWIYGVQASEKRIRLRELPELKYCI